MYSGALRVGDLVQLEFCSLAGQPLRDERGRRNESLLGPVEGSVASVEPFEVRLELPLLEIHRPEALRFTLTKVGRRCARNHNVLGAQVSVIYGALRHRRILDNKAHV